MRDCAPMNVLKALLCRIPTSPGMLAGSSETGSCRRYSYGL